MRGVRVRRHDDDPCPSIFQILAGSHPYSMEPEDETAWCRACLLVGVLLGAALVAVVFG